MNTLFALVLTIGMTNGDFQDVVLGVYGDQQQCEQAAVEQQVSGNCYPVERIIRSGELPAQADVKL
ncbi:MULTISPECIES: DUF1482 family protein [Citrobacter]|uniref:Protein of uncharacterized function (DUF1482) n=1 Tax=Citrobacter youngae TaxID=133448 RepID=A0A9Q8E8Y5_9ENTR|nr:MULTISPECIES: DUF1482 family protein [Citrobacter]HBV7426424.1 DUF1482 family protein [Citrobacter freundii]MBA8105947.1 DUF1482 family protein [Citrobacter sp. RHBSTW-00029]MBJ8924052.1 DUF1482 family protein [Citrobacter sp. FDAARGOS_156]MBU3800496.1 DUF1482 family protein [Citrobacter youngae]MCM8841836.1 YebW family protein [Citrobacter cronae]